MRSWFSFLGGSANHLLDTGALSDFDKREHFCVKWVVHRYETLPAEVENSVIQAGMRRVIVIRESRGPPMDLANMRMLGEFAR